jgi:hypothetical protein
LATPNYSYEKRQRELAKKRKTEEKRQRKLSRPEGSGDAPEGAAEPAGVESAPESAGNGTAPDNQAASNGTEPPRA